MQKDMFLLMNEALMLHGNILTLPTVHVQSRRALTHSAYRLDFLPTSAQSRRDKRNRSKVGSGIAEEAGIFL